MVYQNLQPQHHVKPNGLAEKLLKEGVVTIKIYYEQLYM